MTATTHVDLRLRAIKNGIKTKVIHGSSIVTAVSGLLGLQNYKFGRTTTLAYPEKDYFPTSPYDVIKENKKMEEKHKENIFNELTVICVVARAGSDEPITVAGAVNDLIDRDFGPPLHTMVIPGKLHFMEIEALETLAQLPAQQGGKIQKL